MKIYLHLIYHFVKNCKLRIILQSHLPSTCQCYKPFILMVPYHSLLTWLSLFAGQQGCLWLLITTGVWVSSPFWPKTSQNFQNRINKYGSTETRFDIIVWVNLSAKVGNFSVYLYRFNVFWTLKDLLQSIKFLGGQIFKSSPMCILSVSTRYPLFWFYY